MRPDRRAMVATATDAARFWSRVDRRGPDECWPYRKQPASKRGVFHLPGTGKTHNASRVAYAIAFGTFDPTLEVAHRCDNGPCCNPTHLFLATHLENEQDKMRKGRFRSNLPQHRGLYPGAVGTGRFTADEADELRALVVTGVATIKGLARQHKSDRNTIRKIVRGQFRVVCGRAVVFGRRAARIAA